MDPPVSALMPTRSDGRDVGAFYREEILPVKLAIDLDYVDKRTLLLDLSVLARTVVGLFVRPKR